MILIAALEINPNSMMKVTTWKSIDQSDAQNYIWPWEKEKIFYLSEFCFELYVYYVIVKFLGVKLFIFFLLKFSSFISDGD